MKFILSIALLFLLTTTHVDAQKAGATLGVGFGTVIKSPGLQVGGFYHLRDDIRVAADFTYYMTKEDSNFGLALLQDDWMEVNANAQFGYIPEDNIFLYSLAGFNVSFTEKMRDNKITDTKFGVNLGGGFDVRRSFIGFYGEAKYTLFTEQFSVFIGSRFYF
jgi:hypothetical protein